MFGAYGGNPMIFTDVDNQAYWAAQSLDASTPIIIAGPNPLGFSRLQIVWDRTTPVGTREDVMSAGMSWCAAAGGACTPLSVAEKSSIETALNTFRTGVGASASNQITLREYRWYDYQPITSRPGPVDRVTAVGSAYTGAGVRLPDQLAITSTYKTCSRKHWGRSYWPFAIPANLDLTYGRVSAGFVPGLAGLLRTLLQSTGGSGIVMPCVASIDHHGVLGVKELQVDNVADVIRSRRAKVGNVFSRFTS